MRQWFEFACNQRPLNHYQLLGLELYESRPEVIEAAGTRITQFLHSLAAGPARAQAERLLQEVAAAQLCLLGPAKKAAYDAQLRAELVASDGPPAPAADPANPPEIAPLIKVETSSASSRGKGKQTGRRRDSSTFVPPPDFGPIVPTADRPAPTPGPSETAVPIVEIRPTLVASARQRTPQRRPDQITLPGEIGLDQPPHPAAETESPAGRTESEAIQVCADGRGGDKRQPAQRTGAQRSAAPRLAGPRNLTAGRRKPSIRGWAIAVVVCGISAAAVVALLVYLLGRPPVASRPPMRQTAAAEPVEVEVVPPKVNPQATRPSKTSAPEKATPRPRPPATEQGGVREFSKQEVTQRRQGIDSFATMAQSQETKLHRDEPPGMPQEPEPPQVNRPEEAPAAITEGLLAHWSFTEKSREQAIDDSPHVRPGYLDGRPVSIADGALGSALRFDGQDDCLRVPDGMLKGAAGAISLWLRTNDMTEPKYLLSSAGQGAVFSLRLQAGQLIAGGGQDAGSKPISAAALRSKAWHHVALTWKSGGEVVLYVDGQPAGRQTAAQLPDPTGVVIGKDAVSGKCFAIDVDEIRLFNRPLSPQEVTAHRLTPGG
jgi:hypothetical protein